VAARLSRHRRHNVELPFLVARSSLGPRIAQLALQASRLHPGPRRDERGEVPMSETVSDFVWRRLAEWGVDRIYGYPGDGINGMLGALNRISRT
jgi:hypothetical protein